VFGEARRALRERTAAALERRIAELPAPAFEALARVLLQREGFGPATFVKRVDGTIYVEALRGPRGAFLALPGRVQVRLGLGPAAARSASCARASARGPGRGSVDAGRPRGRRRHHRVEEGDRRPGPARW
jgi:hypothetical protein